ncbi:MAG: acyltransferase [Muribaculaceae bacterium]|nr:acyltransferase [Muribaculaceae bacterium]
MTTTERIQFIDLAKGVCILLVVMGHLVPAFNENLTFVYCFRMPLYFCLSGLFYKDYGGLMNLTVKKTNKILIPFLAWYLISYAVYYLGRVLTRSQIDAQYHLVDIFTTNDIFNIPIWFLLCLFWSSILFTLIRRVAANEIQTGIGVLVAAGAGWLMSACGVFNFLYVGSALSCMPFFYMGYMLKKSAILYPRADMLKTVIVMAGCLLGASLLAFLPAEPPRLLYYKNGVSAGNVFEIYACAAMFVVGIMLLCKLVGRIPFVSWLGRYSIIVLVTHMPLSAITGTVINKAVGRFVTDDVKYLLNFTVVTVLMLLIIPFCRKCLPYITAQKDLITGSAQSALRRIGGCRAADTK